VAKDLRALARLLPAFAHAAKLGCLIAWWL